MTSRNQIKPPPRSNPIKIRTKDDMPLDKRRKIGNRQALAAVNTKPEATSGAGDVSVTDECETIEFTKDKTELLLNENIKPKFGDYKGTIKLKDDQINRLKQRIRGFVNSEEGHIQEQEKLKFNLDPAVRKSVDIEDAMKKKEDELKNEELMKLEAIEYHKKEKESRINVEKLHASVKEDLGKTEQKLSAANCEVTSLTNKHEKLQEYNMDLQHHNTTHRRDLATANES